MIVTEERETNEVIRFLVIDAYAKLGKVQYGSDVQEFDPQRLLRYYSNVENQLFNFASRYPDSFQFLPRRAYAYLSKPPLLGDISSSLSINGEMKWIVDQFVIHPLAEISNKILPRYQQKANIDSCKTWTMRSEYAPRFYSAIDLDIQPKNGLAWMVDIDAARLSKNMP